MTKLTPQQIEKIISVKTILQQAENLIGVPWQAIAAIWYRESFSIAPPATPGGSFQFDPFPAPKVITALLSEYCLGNIEPSEFNPYETFKHAVILAACWLRHQCKFNLKEDHSDAALKDAFYGYNGRAWGPYPESSPYVYNNFDLQHTNMPIRGSIPTATGRKFISTIDRRPGAFTVYRQLVDAKV